MSLSFMFHGHNIKTEHNIKKKSRDYEVDDEDFCSYMISASDSPPGAHAMSRDQFPPDFVF